MNTSWLYKRETGIKFPLGTADKLAKSFYSSFSSVKGQEAENNRHGGVFNLEFSPDGKMLAAACERKCVLIYDSLSRKRIHSIEDAHLGCVNCVRFLDSRMFATCSDDNSVALWDARHLKHRIRSLHGHNNWVKNIEYSSRDNLLVTSGFDGCIFTWDINSSTEQGFLYNKVFHTNGLMRMKLSPDASKMLICTTSGYIIVIHNLNLNTMLQDLTGFKPNMYRLMQINERPIPIATNFTPLFSPRRNVNRVEFISDFPDNDNAEVVSSLQVHPQGWCAVSRNISRDECTEWTCIHDIQDIVEDCDSDKDTEKNENKESKKESVANRSTSQSQQSVLHWPSIPIRSPYENELDVQSRRVILHRRSNRMTPVGDRRPRRHTIGETSGNGGVPATSSPSFTDHIAAAASSPSATSTLRPNSPSNIQLHFSSIDIWEALVALRDASSRRGNRRPLDEDALAFGSLRLRSPRLFFRAPPNVRECQRKTNSVPNSLVHQNNSRLTHYIQEPNVGKGYIKEICFSSDGRIICSPFGHGIRLLAFSPTCEELSNCAPVSGSNGITSKPQQLHEIATYSSHSNSVVSTKFSPIHKLLVSGCLGGQIVWHEPCL